MSDIHINSLLSQIRTLNQQAANLRGDAPVSQSDGSFGQLMKAGLDEVNRAQAESAGKAKAFELGDPNVQLADVMVSMQKSKLEFRAAVEVRNRLVSAYQDIMNMQV